MRAGLGTIQQTLAPEASAVLDQSISDAARRGHAQTTPLHVAAALLARPSGPLREACTRSHPASSHPLQCRVPGDRALDLCFSVALDRLPAAPSASPAPPVNNALMAALKRAQASQRRGCPDQLQQPLLAVKVELQQLILSILDDPSVSRVMREASFSSVAVKTAIEQSSESPSAPAPAPPLARSPYVNPRLQQQQHHHQPGAPAGDDVPKVIEVLARSRKRNPILVGESGADTVATAVLRTIEKGEVLGNVKIVHLNADENKELGSLIQTHLTADDAGVVLHLGDLKWLMEGGDSAATAVTEIGKVMAADGARVRLIGTANCATYLRLQVNHPSVESQWELQAVPISQRYQPPHSLLRGNNTNGILTSSIGLLASSKPSLGSSKPSSLLTRGGAETIFSQGIKDPNSRKLLIPTLDKAKSGGNLPRWLQAAVTSPQEGDGAVGKSKPTRLLQAPDTARAESNPGRVKTDLVLGGSERTFELLEGKKGDGGDYKELVKGLLEAVPWQRDAASAVALAVTRSRSGEGRRRPDTWLLLMGPDKVGKRRMAAALSERLFSAPPVVVGLAGAAARGSRGKTVVDRLAEALRRSPFAVFLLEGAEAADAVALGSLRRAMERGRLPDAHGREVSLSGAVLVLTSAALPEGLGGAAAEAALREEARLEAAAGREWRFELMEGSKRRRKGAPKVSLDLNLALGAEEGENEDEDEEGLSSSDVTWESGPAAEPPGWMVNGVDAAVAFSGVDMGDLRKKAEEGLTARFEAAWGRGRRLEVDEEVVDCLVGSAWFGDGGAGAVEGRLEEAFAAGTGGIGAVARLVAVPEEGGVGLGWRCK